MAANAENPAVSSYHAVEHFYFQSYLNGFAELPLGINIEDLCEARVQENEVPNPPYLLLQQGLVDDLSRSICNAVARLALETIADRLPRFSLIGGAGVMDSTGAGRQHSPTSRPVVSLPNYLFEINWATSGPGYSWEESYHVSYIPEYGRYLVTASQDSPDALGFCDVCIGHFGASSDVVSDALQIVKEWWGGKVAEYDANEYERVTSVGSASIEQIGAITKQVWASGENT